MSTYREIIGKKIKKVSSDPSSGLDGEMWYNSTTGTLRGRAIIEAWVSTSPMSSPRATMAGGGTNTSAITTGKNGANPSDAAFAESYNGTGWANETNVPTALGYASGTGSSSEAYVQIGGGYPSKTGTVLDYDGSSWTSATAVPGGGPGYIEAGAAGPSADALVAGGNNGETTTWERGGGSWTSGGAMASGVYAPTLVGTQTAAISMGGVTYPGGYKDYNQDYNGTAWTSLTVLPSIRGYSGGAGIQTLSMIIGGGAPGSPGLLAACLKWDGSSWTSIANLGTARNTMCPMGKTIGTAVATPGNQTPAGTEEYNSSTTAYTAAAWASGGAMGTARYAISGVGTQTAALGAMGYTPSGKPASWKYTEEYNGSTWSEQTDMSTARFSGGAFGVQTSAIFAGGNLDPGYSDAVEEYNGSSWTNVTSLPAVRKAAPGFGVETAGVVCGGNLPAATDTSLEYNGSSWTAGGTMPTTGGGENSGSGILTAGLFVVGATTPPAVGATYEYNGSAWTAGGTTLDSAPGRALSSAGTQASSIIFGGDPQKNSAEGYDGTAWSTRPSLATGRSRLGGAGTATAGLALGGKTTAVSTATEEFTGETTAANIGTFTTS